MSDFTALPNLGPKSNEMLRAAGIKSLEELRSLGSVPAYLKVKATGAKASLNLLWALEGAITGLPWQVIAREHRLSLLLALEAQRGLTPRSTPDPLRRPA